MSDVTFCRLLKIPKLKCVFPSDFTQRSLSKSIAFCSYFISSIRLLAFKPNLVKEAIAFGSFEPPLIFLMAFNCFFLDLQFLLVAFHSNLQYFSVSLMVLLFFLLLLRLYLKIYSTKNNQI